MGMLESYDVRKKVLQGKVLEGKVLDEESVRGDNAKWAV